MELVICGNGKKSFQLDWSGGFPDAKASTCNEALQCAGPDEARWMRRVFIEDGGFGAVGRWRKVLFEEARYCVDAVNEVKRRTFQTERVCA